MLFHYSDKELWIGFVLESVKQSNTVQQFSGYLKANSIFIFYKVVSQPLLACGSFFMSIILYIEIKQSKSKKYKVYKIN